ncbi:hypothetical protein SAMN05421682_11043 [Chryseobacterium indoltheticum]|uniref:Uncharacterized protein n=1 Tax=Chryseobacterium indoltheticum TaxID=254 RepID=A0A381FB55_9FLAO|nr:hypothetical protein SAMN05421682_11043 [Chryseobacterium indoltheticum]SUX43811.1 Uncharacterised protein [Chryseobacterium indoltheticum]
MENLPLIGFTVSTNDKYEEIKNIAIKKNKNS